MNACHVIPLDGRFSDRAVPSPGRRLRSNLPRGGRSIRPFVQGPFVQGWFTLVRGEIGAAFERLQDNVQKVDDPAAEAADRYLALSPSERETARVLTLTNAARKAVNESVRDGLQQEGTVARASLKVAGLANQQFTEAELADARSYAPGMRVQSLVTSKEYGLKKQELYVVREIDRRGNRLTVTHEGEGSTLSLPLSASFNRRELGKALVAYDLEAREFASGDLVRYCITDPASGVTNGQRARIYTTYGSV